MSIALQVLQPIAFGVSFNLTLQSYSLMGRVMQSHDP